MSLRPLWLFLTPALAAALWQTRALLRADAWEPPRVLAVVASLVLTAWILRARHRESPALGSRVALALGTAGLLWISVLEFLVGRSTPRALAFLALGSAALILATLLFARTRSADAGATDGPETGLARVLLRLAISGCALAVTLTSIEAALRVVTPLNLYAPVPDDPQFGGALIPDEHGRVVAVPGFRGQFVHPQFSGIRVEINDWGLRDGLDEARPPEPGSVSILTLGDSFLFGTGVALEEMFAERLEARATEFSAAPVRVYNGGIPGYGAIHSRLRLRELAGRVQPDVVILAIFEDNDFQDNWGAKDLWDEQPSEAAVQAARGPGEARRRELRSLRFFLDAVRGFPYWGATSALIQVTQLDLVLLRLGLIDPVAHTNLFLNISLMREPPPLVDQFRDATFDQLELLREHSRELDAELVVLLIPSAIQANPARFESFVAAQRDATPEQFDRTAFHDDLADRLRARGFLVVDTLAALEAEILAGRPCYHREGHWNAAGNRVATEALIPALKRLLE